MPQVTLEQSKSTTFSRRRFESFRRAGGLESLGRVAITSPNYEELRSYEQRQYDEVFSACVEGLRGRVATSYPFSLVEGRLVAEDGEDIEQLLRRGLEDAEELAGKDKFFSGFLPQRAQAELDEHMENLSMAKGEAAFNTNIVISPYAEEWDTSEVNHQKLRRGAQKPQFKRAMVRVSHWDGQKLHMLTRSVDNSSVELLRKTAKNALGYEYETGDSTQMLSERIHLKLADQSWQTVPDRVVAEADKLLRERRGGDWLQGRLLSDAEDLQRFVRENNSIVLHLIGVSRQLSLKHSSFESYKQAFDIEFYNHLALLEARLENNDTRHIQDMAAASGAAGAKAGAEGRSYDMCGTLLSAQDSLGKTAAQTGSESILRLVGKKISCPECSSKVVVPAEDLMRGKLTCSDCGHGVDVCTGARFKKPPSKPKPALPQPDFFERLGQDLRKYEQQRLAREEVNRQIEERKNLESKRRLAESS